MKVYLSRWVCGEVEDNLQRFEHEAKPRLGGQASLIRYADDAIIVFASQRDARRVMAGSGDCPCSLPSRMGSLQKPAM